MESVTRKNRGKLYNFEILSFAKIFYTKKSYEILLKSYQKFNGKSEIRKYFYKEK